MGLLAATLGVGTLISIGGAAIASADDGPPSTQQDALWPIIGDGAPGHDGGWLIGNGGNGVNGGSGGSGGSGGLLGGGSGTTGHTG